jgi:hypothetical protein
LDDNQPDENIREAINSKNIGILKLKALIIKTGRDKLISLKIKV